MNLPNKITIFRVVLIPIMMAFLYVPVWGSYAAAAVFALASLTDWIDGYLARKHNLVTNFGKFADPLADKLLVVAAMLCLVETGRIYAYLAFIIIAREFIITGLRIIAVSDGKVIAASYLGKVKTTVQLIALLLIMVIGEFDIKLGFYTLSNWFMLISAVMTVISGVDYIIKNKEVLKN